MDIVAKDVVSVLSREVIDGHTAYVRRPLPAMTADAEFMELFQSEASRMEGLTQPTLLRYDEWHEGGWIMKVAPGFVSLFDALTKRPAAMCSASSVVTIATAIIQHLDYLHRHGLWMVQLSVHNVLVNPSTLQVRLLPPLSPYLELRRNIFAGQPDIAPETSIPSEVGIRADFYGLSQILFKFKQFSPLPRSLNIIATDCGNEDPALRLGNTIEMMRIIERADKGRKAIPYLIGAGVFAVLLAMFLFTDSGDTSNTDTRYIKPEEHQPSAEGVPDSINLMMEQYREFLSDSITADGIIQSSDDF